VSRAWSVSARRVYGKAQVCRLWGGPARRIMHGRPRAGDRPLRPAVAVDRRCPMRPWWMEGIRQVLSEAEALGFTGEGYRKVWARFRHKGIAVSKERVRRLMRADGLQAPHRAVHVRGPLVHGGTIIPMGPNRMWGTDATQVATRREGLATVFVAIDHFVGDVVGIHAARPGTRFEALEPIHQGLRDHFGDLEAGIASGLLLRHDHGLRFLGIESSPSFVKAPEGNGVVERFICTLKEQLLWVRTFDTVEELRQALLEFKDRFNKHWLLQRHGYATPAQVRAAHAPVAEAA